MAVEDKPSTPLSYCTIVRPSNYLDRMFYIEHRIGVQANVLISAHYTPTSTTAQNLLSEEQVYSAVRSVIATYPELSIIGVREPVGKKGHHGLSLAALHEIDLDTCIEFRDDEPPVAGPEAIERLHNEWSWTDEQFNPRQPWWKAVVLGRQTVVFVFHHLVADGRFGQFFHREFLAGLNSAGANSEPTSRIIKIDPERVRLDKETEAFWKSSMSILNVIHSFFVLFILRLFMGRRLPFTDIPKAKPYVNSLTNNAPLDQCTKTRIASLRIPAPRMRRILSACRENGTTFTALLWVMTTSTLALDYYPKAKIGITNLALDMRSLYPPENPDGKSGKLLQSAGGMSKFAWLDSYRRIFKQSGPSDKSGKKVDAELAWKLARDYRAIITKRFTEKNPKLLVMYKASNSMGNDLDDMLSSTFPALGLYLNNAFQISNLGSLKMSDGQGPWKIDDMGFSAACINGNLSSNVGLNAIGVDGGDTVILACYEDAVMSEELVSGILEATLDKMEALL